MKYEEFLAEIGDAKNIGPEIPQMAESCTGYILARYMSRDETRVWELRASYWQARLSVRRGTIHDYEITWTTSEEIV